MRRRPKIRRIDRPSVPSSYMSHVSNLELEHDTTLTPVLFRDGADRRAGARVPIRGAVKMGPPQGEPYAVVVASDLSRSGLFIEADRAVRVGARFSAEITLSSGEVVYVAEAEVAYNRDEKQGGG